MIFARRHIRPAVTRSKLPYCMFATVLGGADKWQKVSEAGVLDVGYRAGEAG